MAIARTLWDIFRDREVYGFHGNTRSRIERTIRENFVREGQSGDWLGAGLYFWQDAPNRAWDWAKNIARRDSLAKPTEEMEEYQVMVVRLQTNDHWIDLIEQSSWTTRFHRAANAMVVGGWLPNQPNAIDPGNLQRPMLHKRDYAIIELAINLAFADHIAVDAVRCAFVEGTPVFENSAIFDKTHVQITVRNPDVIVEYQVLSDGA